MLIAYFKVPTVQWFIYSASTELHGHLGVNLRTFAPSHKESAYLLPVTPIPPKPSQPQATTSPLSFSVGLPGIFL